MKIKILTILGLFTILLSCSSDNQSNIPDDSNTNPTNAYLPLKTTSYWIYDVSSSTINERDSLYVDNDITINSKTYKSLKTQNAAFGFYSNSLRNNGLRKEGNSLLFSGSFGNNTIEQLSLNIALDDFVIFKEDAPNKTTLSSISGEVSQVIEGYSAYPLKLKYKMKTTAVENLPTYMDPNGTMYSEVKAVKTILNLDISISILSNPVTIMTPQDVVTSVQYFAKNIGMVHAKTTINYQLDTKKLDILSNYGITIPIPQSFNDVQEEVLDTYKVE